MTNNTKLTSLAALLTAVLAITPAHGADTIALGGGSKLQLDKKTLSLIDATGRVRASVPMRAEQLDARMSGNSGLAVVRDSATQHARLLAVDTGAGTLADLPPLGAQAFGVDALCLFRDRQGIDQLFLAGKDGQAEQWLVQGGTARLLRKLALPPGTEQCKVDDATQTLYVDEPGVGTWAYVADSEAPPTRSLLRQGARLKPARREAAIFVAPLAQTEPVPRMGDVADDPAIWVHPGDKAGTLVLGTNKKQGLMVYDLQGKLKQFLDTGRLNNVDLRQGVMINGRAHDLAVASQRDDNTVVLFGISAEGQVGELARIATGFQDIYGICLFQPRAGGLEVIVNDKSGAFKQYGIGHDGASWSGKLLRSFKLASQPEGCVADDARERLFVGEEKRGVWTLSARSDQTAAPKLVLGVGKHLHADVEGVAIYHGGKTPYLIVSSQGDSSYAVLDALPPFRLRGRFKVGFNLPAGIDGTSDTDGLDVTHVPLGAGYPEGMLVIQDGYKRLPDGSQNFKYLSWADVARALKL